MIKVEDTQKIKLFSNITETDLPLMLDCLGGHKQDFKKNAYISIEDDHVKNIGIVLSGAVDMVKEDVWGNVTLLMRIMQGEMFGETFACSVDTSSMVNFRAARDTTVMFLPFHRVMHSCGNSCMFHHQLIENMVELIAKKNKELMEKVSIVSQKTLREKLLAYLSSESQRQNSRYFEVPLKRVELAEYLCADRSALTRELSTMKADGLIDYERNMFRLLV